MCGLVGVCHLNRREAVDPGLLERMLGMIAHRGPDEFGTYRDDQVGLGSARLSVLDLKTGGQPISNEDGTVWIVYNGEVFNFVELREELEAAGHRFSTNSDTEVIIHLYEEHGFDCVKLLNGQFAFAIWDRRPSQGEGVLFLARDRVGICPLFYTIAEDSLILGSEIKALLAHPSVIARLDPISLAQIFTFWTTLSPRTPFADIAEVPPGHTLRMQEGKITVSPYWSPSFPDAGCEPARSREDLAEELLELLVDATQIRLRADVAVGAYLSGGLDSSATTALIRNHNHNYLRTFSVMFADPAYDEREHQARMVAYLGTDHSSLECTDKDIGEVFPDVIWHTEWPILRTAPAPLYLLSRLVRENGMKVVLTGEGADEFLGGYNIYKETKLRRFWAANPTSQLRPLLLRRLYPYVQGLGESGAIAQTFFGRGIEETERLDYSHMVRWANTAPLRRFLAPEVQAALKGYSPEAEAISRLEDHPDFRRWSYLAKAQFIEISIFLSEYLLSSQGDRMLMSHSVEGRFPFMDHRVIELASRIPPHLKIRGLREKAILKLAMKGLLPPEVTARVKRPYRAPIHHCFLGDAAPAYVRELLSPEAIQRSGYFAPQAVAHLLQKGQHVEELSEREGMGLAGIVSTQLVHQLFVEDPLPQGRASVRPLKAVERSGSSVTITRHE